MLAEDIVLAVIMQSSRERDRALAVGLSPEYFTGARRRLFELLMRLGDYDLVSSAVAVYATEDEEVKGLAARLTQVYASLGVTDDISVAARKLMMARNIKKTADTVGKSIARAIREYDPEQLYFAVNALARVADEFSSCGNGVIHLHQIDRTRRILRIPTGFTELDNATGGGFPAPSLIVISGRPGMGKTSAMMTLAMNMAAHGNVMYYTLEMSPEQIVSRVRNIDTTLPIVFTNAREIPGIRALSMYRPSVELWNIERERAGLHPVEGIAAIFVDYIQLMRGEYDSEVARVNAAVDACLQLSQRVGCPVVIASQAQRAADDGDRSLHVIGHQSSAIEHAADYAFLINRVTVDTARGKTPVRLAREDGTSGYLVAMELMKARYQISQDNFYFMLADRMYELTTEQAGNVIKKIKENR